MLWQGVSKALRTRAKCICSIRPSTHLIENLRGEREGAGKKKGGKSTILWVCFLKGKKKRGGGKEKGITYSCSYILGFNSIPVTLNTLQNGSHWSPIADGLLIGSCRSLPCLPSLHPQILLCRNLSLWHMGPCLSLPCGNVYDRLPTIAPHLPLGESPASGFLVANGSTSWMCEEWIAKYYPHDPNRKDSVGGKPLENQ